MSILDKLFHHNQKSEPQTGGGFHDEMTPEEQRRLDKCSQAIKYGSGYNPWDKNTSDSGRWDPPGGGV